MKYEAIRTQIKTGDVVAIHGRGLLPTVIRLVQKIGGLGDLSTITHTGVAWWIEGRLYMIEMDGLYNVLRPLSQYINQDIPVSIYQCPVSNAMAAQFERATANMIRYSLFDLLRIGLRLLSGGKNRHDNERNLVCSTFVARWLQWAGWIPPIGFPNMPSPGELCQALGTQPTFAIKVASKKP